MKWNTCFSHRHLKREIAMTDEECLVIYNQLIDVLEKEGKAWLVDQVENLIHQGKVSQLESVETFFQDHVHTDALILYSDQEERETATFHLDYLSSRRDQVKLLLDQL